MFIHLCIIYGQFHPVTAESSKSKSSKLTISTMSPFTAKVCWTCYAESYYTCCIIKCFFTEQYIINIFTNQYRYIVLMAAENFIIERSIVYLTNLYWWICRVLILLYNNQCCHEQPYLEILPHLIVTFSYILRERIVGSNTPLHYIWNIFTSCFPKWIE